MTGNLGIFVSFFAGLVSFLSPCVLPLIPGFLAYLAGSTLSDSKSHRLEIFLNSLFFVLGFSVFFAFLGVILNSVLINIADEAQTWLARIGGVIIIFFGLYLTGLIHIGFLDAEHKLNVGKKFKSKYVTSFVFGAAFSAGWTPCVGAVLGAILGLAATQPGSAFALLLSYSLGLGLPFLLVGLFTSQASSFFRKHAKGLSYVKIVFGVAMIILGILAFTQNLGLIANFEVLNQFLLQGKKILHSV
ncbi:MAG TPA: cytochrome c biogenesis protein CcdA [Candidatus Gracilibacteria bacterium]|nr:cytochrome c biogenesis protein CcdA [Candidatus Gracilibacteria bacterium]